MSNPHPTGFLHRSLCVNKRMSTTLSNWPADSSSSSRQPTHSVNHSHVKSTASSSTLSPSIRRVPHACYAPHLPSTVAELGLPSHQAKATIQDWQEEEALADRASM